MFWIALSLCPSALLISQVFMLYLMQSRLCYRGFGGHSVMLGFCAPSARGKYWADGAHSESGNIGSVPGLCFCCACDIGMNSAPALPVGSGGLFLAMSAARPGLGGCVLNPNVQAWRWHKLVATTGDS